jgi:hypothetical protein
MSRIARIGMAITAVGLLAALFVVSIPHAFDTEVSEVNVANIQSSGHTNQYAIGSHLLVTFNNQMRALFRKQCNVCTQMWLQLGGGWSTSGGQPPAEACTEQPQVPGCKPALQSASAAFLGCPPGCGHSPYELSWSGSANATSFEVQYNWGGSWGSYYSGTGLSVLASTGPQYTEFFRVRAVNSYGASDWINLPIHVQCSDMHDPW